MVVWREFLSVLPPFSSAQDTAVDHLEAGDFVSMSMNCQMEVGNVTLDMLTTVMESGRKDLWL